MQALNVGLYPSELDSGTVFHDHMMSLICGDFLLQLFHHVSVIFVGVRPRQSS